MQNPLLTAFQRSYSWTVCDSVNQIAEQLFSQIEINYFDYARFYPDNSCYAIFNDREYVNFFLSYNEYDEYQVYHPPTHYLPAGKHLWVGYIDDDFLQKASEKFNHYWGLSIVRKHPEYDEIINFSTHYDNKQILDIYLNDDRLLDAIVAFMLGKFKIVLTKKKYNIQLPIRPEIVKIRPSHHDNVVSDILTQLKRTNKLRKDQCCLLVGNELVSFSRREMQCLNLLFNGLTAKQIARRLNISFRTVEVYCGNLIHKTDSHNRYDLISKIDSRLLNQVVTTYF